MLIYIYAIRLKQFEILHTVSKTGKQLLTRELAFCMMHSHSLCNNWYFKFNEINRFELNQFFKKNII